jgi:hypothetical protein
VELREISMIGGTGGATNKIDAVRIFEGLPAKFLRFGKAGEVVILVGDAEREIKLALWRELSALV